MFEVEFIDTLNTKRAPIPRGPSVICRTKSDRNLSIALSGCGCAEL